MHIEERISRGISSQKPSETWMLNFMVELRSNWRDAEKAVTHTVGFLCALIAVFELLVTHSVGDISLGVAKVTNVVPVETFLPAIVAFLYGQIAVQNEEIRLLAREHEELFRQTWPLAARQNLDQLLNPVNTIVSGLDRLATLYFGLTDEYTQADILADYVKSHIQPHSKGQLSGRQIVAGAAVGAVGSLRYRALMVGPYIFEVQAFYVLFSHAHRPGPLLWVSLGASVFFLIGSVVSRTGLKRMYRPMVSGRSPRTYVSGAIQAGLSQGRSKKGEGQSGKSEE